MASEIENNDSISDSNTLVSGTQVTGSFSNQTDVDYFKIEVNKDETISLDFDWKATSSLWPNNYAGQLKVEVFNSASDLIVSKTPIGYSNNPYTIGHTGQKISFSTGAKVTGTYYIKISNNISPMDTLDAGYSLTVNSQTTSQMYELEGNNTTSNSNIISSEKSVIGQLSSASDVDIYKIIIPKLKRSGIDGEATIIVSDWQNVVAGSKIFLTLGNGNTITLESEAVGAQNPSNRSGNTIYFRPYENNNTTADNIYNALNSQSEFSVSNPGSNVVTVNETSSSPNTYLTLSTSDSARLTITSPKGYPDVATIISEYSGANHIFRVKDSNGLVLKLKDSNGVLQDFLPGGKSNATATFDVLQSGDYFLEVLQSSDTAYNTIDYKGEIFLALDQPNTKVITLGSTFETATDLSKLSNLDEGWIYFNPNGTSKGFFKVDADQTFENYDRLFLRIIGSSEDTYGFRSYDSSGNSQGAWLSSSNMTMDLVFKSLHQAQVGEAYYTSDTSIIEIYEATGKTITSTLGMVTQHHSPLILSSSNSLSQAGEYTVPTGAQVYASESIYSIINSDGLKLSVSGTKPVVVALKHDISKVISSSSLSDVTNSPYLIFGFGGFDVENIKNISINAYDKSTGLSLKSGTQFHEDTGYFGGGAYRILYCAYPLNSNEIIIEITTETSSFINGILSVEPWIGDFDGTTTITGDLYPDRLTAQSSQTGLWGSLGPDYLTAFGDDNVLSGWTGNDYLVSGPSDRALYSGSEVTQRDDLEIYPYTGNDIVKIQRSLDAFELSYTDIHYPHEALEIGYDEGESEFLVKGENFTDWIDFTHEVNNFIVSVGAFDIETKPITISSAEAPVISSFWAGFASSPDLWEIGRVSDVFNGHKNVDDLVGLFSTKSDLSGFLDLSINLNESQTGLTASATLTSGESKKILEFAETETLLIEGGNNKINLGLKTTAVFTGEGNDEIYSSSSPDFISAGGGNDTITLTSGSVWEQEKEAWNVNIDSTIFYKVPITGKLKFEDIIMGGAGTDTINMGTASEAVFFHDVFSSSTQSNLLNYFVTNTSVLETDVLAMEKTRLTAIETINAGEGDDIVDLTSPDYKGLMFHVSINGGSGNDVLWGNKGYDQLNGGDGDDLLFGGEGQDHLTGGAGKDVFEFSAETLTNTPPHDVIADYKKSEGDLIRFYVQSNDTQDLQITGTNELTWKTSTGNQTIHLNGVALSSLSDVSTQFVTVPAEKTDRYVVYDSNNGWTLANLVGGRNNDTLNGSNGIDKIFGGQGNDILNGNDGADIIYAGPNNDIINGGAGDDIINGGSGNDIIDDGIGLDVVDAGSGIDTYSRNFASTATSDYAFVAHVNLVSETLSSPDYPDSAADQLKNFENVTLSGAFHYIITGDDNDNVINTDLGNDIINGGAGNDTIDGGGGNDTINAGDGDDVVIYKGEGNDTITFGAGNDTLKVSNVTSWKEHRDGDDLIINSPDSSNFVKVIGAYSTANRLENIEYTDISVVRLVSVNSLVPSSGNHFFAGTSGNDTINGGSASSVSATGYDGNDTMTGSAGNDYYFGHAGDDIIKTLAGDDVLVGGTENDTLEGGTGNDTLEGGDGDDTINAGAGNDTINGGDGNDIINGGDGNDIIDDGIGLDVVDAGSGVDTYSRNFASTSSDYAYVAHVNLASETLLSPDYPDSAADQLKNFENVTLSGAFHYIITGNDYDNVLNTDLGNDIINAGAGNDIISGGAGDDIINGGEGNDKLYGGSGNDSIFGGAGDDTLDAASGDDKLYGGAGNDILIHSGSGAQLFDGGAGVDTYKMSAVEAGLNLNIEVNLATGYVGSVTDRDDPLQDTVANIENVDFSLVDWDLVLIGDVEDNTLMAGSGDDTLNGGEGNDKLYGGSGNDSIFGGAGDDIFDGGIGADIITTGSGSDVIVSRAGDGGSSLSDADIVKDFTYGSDTFALAGGLSINDLTIEQGNDGYKNHTIITITASSEYLFVVENITADLFA